MPVIMVVAVAMSVVVPMIMSVPVVGRMGIQLEEDRTHDGIGTRVEAQRVVTGIEVQRAAPLEGQLLLQEIAIERELVVQVEGVEMDDLIDRQVRLLGIQDLGHRVHGTHLTLQLGQFVGRHQIGLVEHDAVGEGDLLLGLGGVVEVQGDVLGVDEGDDAVEAEALLDLVVAEEGLRDGARIGEAGGLDQHVVELVPALHELAEDPDEVAPDGAAEAPVVHLEDLLVGLDDEFVVDADLAEFVLDHGDALAVVGGQDAVQERRLAGAEKAGEDGHRDARVVVFGHIE